MTTPNPPTEVALVHELRGCRDCDSIWENPRYGPFPSCDAHMLPDAGAPPKSLPIAAFEQPAPAALHSCRRAPIMVVGINPNLTGFFTLPQNGRLDGPRAVYPYFANANSYALHHRYLHSNRHEFSMEASDVQGLIDPLALPLVRAPAAGRLQEKPADDQPALADDTHRLKSNRKVWLKFTSTDGITTSKAWRWCVSDNFTVMPAIAGKKLQQGDVIAGVITQNSTVMASASVYVTALLGSSFYRRLQEFCAAASQGVGQELRLGEDLSLHDMVACATPGWSRQNFGIRQQQLSDGCVKSRQFAPRQIVQSRPTLLLLSGLEAFEMFLTHFHAYVKPAHDYATTQASIIAQGHARFALQHDNWSAHVVVVSHLSYPTMPLNAFSPPDDPRLTHLRTKHPVLWQLLQQTGYTTPTAVPGQVCLTPAGWSSIKKNKNITKAALVALEEALGDPRPGIVQALATELLARGQLALSTLTGSPASSAAGVLLRHSQDCRFCETFAIPGGCTYAPK